MNLNNLEGLTETEVKKLFDEIIEYDYISCGCYCGSYKLPYDPARGVACHSHWYAASYVCDFACADACGARKTECFCDGNFARCP